MTALRWSRTKTPPLQLSSQSRLLALPLRYARTTIAEADTRHRLALTVATANTIGNTMQQVTAVGIEALWQGQVDFEKATNMPQLQSFAEFDFLPLIVFDSSY